MTCSSTRSGDSGRREDAEALVAGLYLVDVQCMQCMMYGIYSSAQCITIRDPRILDSI
jgi:hypothetical protein